MRKFQDLEQQLKALANQRRLAILAFLKKTKGATVGEIAKNIGLSSLATSQHLRVLRTLKILTYTKRGLYVSYRLSLHQNESVKKILTLL
ncbi:MAG: metalloregulator ArsR/SmtB family transcription factor [Kiritimatiellales bacterium]|nr:metalloregulator ArsR/SmtB family transcription factor [Kiritimatiellales bacterium]